jgi:hypothetical protein
MPLPGKHVLDAEADGQRFCHVLAEVLSKLKK